MRVIVVVIACVALLLAVPAQGVRPVFFCAVTYDPAVSTPPYLALHVTGTVPNNSVPYLRIDGSQEWTVLHNIKGKVDDWTGRPAVELPSGTLHTAEILDMPKTGVVDAAVIASCVFQT